MRMSIEACLVNFNFFFFSHVITLLFLRPFNLNIRVFLYKMELWNQVCTCHNWRRLAIDNQDRMLDGMGPVLDSLVWDSYFPGNRNVHMLSFC